MQNNFSKLNLYTRWLEILIKSVSRIPYLKGFFHSTSTFYILSIIYYIRTSSAWKLCLYERNEQTLNTAFLEGEYFKIDVAVWSRWYGLWLIFSFLNDPFIKSGSKSGSVENHFKSVYITLCSIPSNIITCQKLFLESHIWKDFFTRPAPFISFLFYGTQNYNYLVDLIQNKAKSTGSAIECFQSNHEGAIIDRLQEAYFDGTEGIVINPGNYVFSRQTHEWINYEQSVTRT